MDRKTLIVVVVAVGVLLIWQKLIVGPYYDARLSEQESVVADLVADETTGDSTTVEPMTLESEETAPSPLFSFEENDPANEPELITLTNENLSLTLSTEGGQLTDLRLLNYTQSSWDTAPVQMVGSQNDTEPAMLPLAVSSSLEGDGLSRAIFSSESPSENTIRMSYITSGNEGANIPSGLAITKTLTLIDGEYDLGFEISLTNTTNESMILSGARVEYTEEARSGSLLLNWGPDLGINPVPDRFASQYVVTGHYAVDDEDEKVSYGDGFFSFISSAHLGDPNIDWAGLSNQYFLACFKPEDAGTGIAAYFHRSGEGSVQAQSLRLLLPTAELAPNESVSFPFVLYVGPKISENLTAIDPSLQPLDGMDPRLLPVSVARWLQVFLKFIYGFIGNYGWAIVIMTVIVKLILFPLTHHQFKSMRKMQTIQPLVKELQAKYQYDRETMNKEVMKLYQEHKVNPLGGCLPMILQIPIFYGLFICLRNAIELRGAPFMLWIHDLSIPDTVFTVGNIPINVLPLLMAGTMLLQQKLSSTAKTNPDQARMMMMMTSGYGYLFLLVPVGTHALLVPAKRPVCHSTVVDQSDVGTHDAAECGRLKTF